MSRPYIVLCNSVREACKAFPARSRGNCLLVFCSILSRANDKTGEAFPAVEWLTEDTGLSEKAVRRAINQLKGAGLIKAERQTHKRGWFANNHYTISEAFHQRSLGTGGCSSPAVSRDRYPAVSRDRSENNSHKNINQLQSSADFDAYWFEHLREKAWRKIGKLDIAAQAAYLVATRQIAEGVFFQAVDGVESRIAAGNCQKPGGLFRHILKDESGDKQLNRKLGAAKREVSAIPAAKTGSLERPPVKRPDTEGLFDD